MASPSPLGVPELTDEYFIENRNRLLEIAAFLDRLCHHCHIFEMNCESYRFRGSMKTNKGRKAE